MVSSASGSATHQAGYQFRFLSAWPGIGPTELRLRPKRVMTPADAYQIGSDYYIVGRLITQAEDPGCSLSCYHDEWNQD